MNEYEIFIEEINPCGGDKYSKKTEKRTNRSRAQKARLFLLQSGGRTIKI